MGSCGLCSPRSAWQMTDCPRQRKRLSSLHLTPAVVSAPSHRPTLLFPARHGLRPSPLPSSSHCANRPKQARPSSWAAIAPAAVRARCRWAGTS